MHSRAVSAFNAHRIIHPEPGMIPPAHVCRNRLVDLHLARQRPEYIADRIVRRVANWMRALCQGWSYETSFSKKQRPDFRNSAWN